MTMATADLALAQSIEDDDDDSLIEPQIERIEFDESKIDSQDFEVSAYAGFLAVENFETDIVIGFNLAYHVSEDFFVRATYGQSDAGETSFEKLSGGAPILSDDEREIHYYLFSIAFNILPGESFVTDETTFNTIFYISGGVGNTEFAGDDRFTIAYSAGYRVLFTDNFSFDVEMRNLLFEMDLFGEDKSTHNLEFTMALNFHF